jgi:probable rRNA maturation factor
VLEVEVLGAEELPGAPGAARIVALCELATSSVGVQRGHLAIEFVDGERIRELNRDYRGLDQPTDVLSFPIDGVDGAQPGEISSQEVPLELGDVVICAEHTEDLEEAIVHGVLHLLGMDHERDQGEMLALQGQLLERAARERS